MGTAWPCFTIAFKHVKPISSWHARKYISSPHEAGLVYQGYAAPSAFSGGAAGTLASISFVAGATHDPEVCISLLILPKTPFQDSGHLLTSLGKIGFGKARRLPISFSNQWFEKLRGCRIFAITMSLVSLECMVFKCMRFRKVSFPNFELWECGRMKRRNLFLLGISIFCILWIFKC